MASGQLRPETQQRRRLYGWCGRRLVLWRRPRWGVSCPNAR
jgi:hypothetical protein